MIIVFTGPMYSGKSTSLISVYEEITDKSSVLCFKPSKDKRDFSMIKARNINYVIASLVIEDFEDILKHIDSNVKYIIIDEAQFIQGDYNILTKLSIENNIDIYVAGLNQTSEQKPFGCMPYLLAIADDIIQLNTICQCGKIANYTYCKQVKEDEILIGDKEYIPVCEKCLLKYRGMV